MIKGMTGYGSAEFASGQTKAVVEVKSLNHRYFDISYYLPIGFGSVENKVRQIVQKHIERGRITVTVKIVQKPLQMVVLNKGAVKAHLKNARVLKKEFSLDNDISVADMIRLPGVVETKETLVSPKEVWPALEKSLLRSLRSLVVMRRSDGKSLLTDVSDKFKRMSLQIKKIKTRSNVILKDKKKSLTTEEFTSFRKGADIHEEMARLQHYVDEMKKLLRKSGSVGKRIDFIAQEMQRETNTIGSKLQDKVVSNGVIALKSKIEKIREQAQNIE